ncbi:hypothetical protein U3516DRAFT_847037 [Neocallimastix sp. 'constans']
MYKYCKIIKGKLEKSNNKRRYYFNYVEDRGIHIQQQQTPQYNFLRNKGKLQHSYQYYTDDNKYQTILLFKCSSFIILNNENQILEYDDSHNHLENKLEAPKLIMKFQIVQFLLISRRKQLPPDITTFDEISNESKYYKTKRDENLMIFKNNDLIVFQSPLVSDTKINLICHRHSKYTQPLRNLKFYKKFIVCYNLERGSSDNLELWYIRLEFINNEGTVHQPTIPYNPQQKEQN